MTEDFAYAIVRGMGVARLVIGVAALPACGLLGWWGPALGLFLLAFATDMVDGELARFWDVVSDAGERLDSKADIALTGGGLCALWIGGVWEWWALAAACAAFAAAQYVKPHLQGDLLGCLIVMMPLVNLGLIALIAGQLLHTVFGWGFGYAVTFMVVIEVVAGLLKYERLLNYFHMAVERSEQPRKS